MRIEWRNRDNEHDILLAVDEESNRVMEAWEADEPLLTDFLNEMAASATTAGRVSWTTASGIRKGGEDW